MMKFALTRKIVIGASFTLATATLATGGVTAARAATQSPAAAPTASIQPLSSIADCRASYSGDLCWWVDTREVGKMHPVRDAISDWTTQKESTCAGGTWNDCASTLYNASNTTAGVYENAHQGGGAYCVEPLTEVPDLTHANYIGLNVSMNDSISSNSWNC